MDKTLSVVLKTSPLTSGLTDEQFKRLEEGNIMKIAQYKRNDILFWTDNPPEKLYILISGAIAMAKDTLSGKRSLSKSNTEKGELIGAVRLFSPKKLLWDYAVVLKDSELLEIESRIFLRQDVIDLDIQTVLLRNIIENVVERIDYLGEKVNILSVTSARKRIALYLLGLQNKNHKIILKSTREEIADYLGMARPSLSRELGKMQDEGIISLVGKEVHIVDQLAFDELFE